MSMPESTPPMPDTDSFDLIGEVPPIDLRTYTVAHYNQRRQNQEGSPNITAVTTITDNEFSEELKQCGFNTYAVDMQLIDLEEGRLEGTLYARVHQYADEHKRVLVYGGVVAVATALAMVAASRRIQSKK